MNDFTTQLKSAIFAKGWANSNNPFETPTPQPYTFEKDVTFNAGQSYPYYGITVIIDRNLAEPLTLKAGTTISFFANSKREGKRDPDFTISAKLPIAQADAIINASKTALQDWRDDNLDSGEVF